MRVLFVGAWLPWPLSSGGKLRVFHLLRTAGREAEIHVHTVLEPDQEPSLARHLEQHVASVRCYRRGPVGPIARWTRPKLERWFFSRELHRALAAELASDAFDLVHVDELALARALPRRSPVPLVQHHHKLDTVLFERTTAGAGPLRHFDLAKLRRLERVSTRRTRHHLVCGEPDARILAARYPHLAIDVLPSGFDPETFRPSEPPAPREPDLVVFVGSMSYAPNVDACVHFVERVWPRVVARRPDARLELVGRDPAPAVRRLASERIVVTGEVPDVRPHLARASVVVVPLRIGGGTRLKLPEALGMGCAVVSTRVGAEGLALEDGEHVALADDEEAFAERTVALLADPVAAAALGARGRARALERYGWDALGAELAAIWRRVAGARGRE